jgi:hypothetical protein
VHQNRNLRELNCQLRNFAHKAEQRVTRGQLVTDLVGAERDAKDALLVEARAERDAKDVLLVVAKAQVVSGEAKLALVERSELLAKTNRDIERDCVICKTNKNNRVLVPCGHAFCDVCMTTQTSAYGNYRCPTCRDPFNRVNVLFVF